MVKILNQDLTDRHHYSTKITKLSPNQISQTLTTINYSIRQALKM